MELLVQAKIYLEDYCSSTNDENSWRHEFWSYYEWINYTPVPPHPPTTSKLSMINRSIVPSPAKFCTTDIDMAAASLTLGILRHLMRKMHGHVWLTILCRP